MTVFEDQAFFFLLRFDTVTFSNNIGNASTAIRFTTALPFARGVDMTPEFINCTFKNNNMSNYARTSPFTSQRVDVNFTGRNIFQQNYGGNVYRTTPLALKILVYVRMSSRNAPPHFVGRSVGDDTKNGCVAD